MAFGVKWVAYLRQARSTCRLIDAITKTFIKHHDKVKALLIDSLHPVNRGKCDPVPPVKSIF